MATLADRHYEAADGAAALITAAWAPAEPDGVTRDEVAEETYATMEGRQVFVFLTEAGAAEVERLNRGEVVNGFKISVRCYEKYTDPGRPTAAWMDERRTWLDTIYTALDKSTEGQRMLTTLWTQTLEITDVTDAEAVAELNLFVASIEVEFREVASG